MVFLLFMRWFVIGVMWNYLMEEKLVNFVFIYYDIV